MRMWEIRENHEDESRYGRRASRGDESSYRHSMRSYKDPEEEAYDCGYEDGYRDAMKESKHSERRDYR